MRSRGGVEVEVGGGPRLVDWSLKAVVGGVARTPMTRQGLVGDYQHASLK